ncbi:MAG: COX15/CtaA family protein [Bacteroidota bacterium]
MEKRFTRLAVVALVFIYLVILAGSIVRTTGSGMGCPDWPKCFGQWIPPADSTQLPENYKEVNAQKRAVKIEEFAKLLEKIGLSGEGEKIRNDKSLLEEENFNAAKTWTEYINRLIGFIAGNLVLILFFFSFALFRKNPQLFFLSLLNLLLIGFTAWFGSIVVATNLLPWTITLHMFVALLIVVVQVVIIHRSGKSKFRYKAGKFFSWMVVLSMLMTIVQIYLGTQVRQQIDVIAETAEMRSTWVDQLDVKFVIHRSFSWGILLINFLLFWHCWKKHLMINGINLLFLLTILEATAGISLAYLGMPAWVQPVHLMLAAIMLGVQVNLILKSGK